MLSSLTIRNILLIDLVDLEFKKGLNTLTGETGVGKSVLLDCLGFVLGWNNNTQLLREGTTVGEVIAEFKVTPKSDVFLTLAAAGFNCDETVIIRRMINKSDGRKRSFINDKSVSLDLIKSISKGLVEVQDQTGNQILLNEQSHLEFLDKFAGLTPQLIDLRRLWKQKESQKKELEDEVAQYKLVESQKEYLVASTEEIRQFDPRVGEEEELDLKRRQIKSIEKNKEKFQKINKIMSLGDVEKHISDVIKLLDSIRESTGDVVDASVSALDQTLNEFASASSEITKLLESQNFDTYELENTEERLFKLRALGRKYNVKTGELNVFLEEMISKLVSLDTNYKKIVSIQDALDKRAKAYDEKAKSLSERRLNAAKALDQMVMNELKYLKMVDCLFKTELSASKPSSRGVDNAIFKVATNRGGKLSRLKTISSGGEMSRFLLALKVCLTDQEQGTTMIFDEIDRGIGGATADSVGRRLASLAEHSQIIVVTHSPQVAAHGDHQWKVEKQVSNDKMPVTRIEELGPKKRLNEIARMLSGKEISTEALAAAKKLLG